MALIVRVYVRDILDDIFVIPTKVIVERSQYDTAFHELLQKNISSCLERITHRNGIAIYHQAVRAKPWWEKFRERVLEAQSPNQITCGKSSLCFPNGYCAVALVPTSSGFLARLYLELVVGQTDGDGWEEAQRKRRRAAHESMIELAGYFNLTTSSFGSPVNGSTSV
jgi:hypothetical protein